MRGLSQGGQQTGRHFIRNIAKKGFTYFLIYHYFFFSPIVYAGTYPARSPQENYEIDNLRGAVLQPKLASRGEDNATEPISSNTSQIFFSRLVSYFSQSLSNIQTKLTSSVKNTLLEKAEVFSKWAYEELKDIPSLRAKTAHEAAFDKGFWQVHYNASVQELQDDPSLTPTQIQIRLEELQDIVLNGLLSAYLYEEGLKELEGQVGQQVQSTKDQFRARLKAFPSLLEKGFHEDLLNSLRAIERNREDAHELTSILTYYRPLMNSLDYKITLKGLRTFLQNNKTSSKLHFTKGQYGKVITALNEGIERTKKEERKVLKQERRQFFALSNELPFFLEEISPQGIWADVEENDSFKSLSRSTSTKPLVSQLLSKLGTSFMKGTDFALKHPFQAITLGLATQVAAVAALKSFFAPRPNETDDESSKTKERANSVLENSEDLSLHDYSERALGDEFQINQNTTRNVYYNPSVVSLNNGNTLVVWQYGSPNNYNTYYRMFYANGTALANELQINQNPYQSECIYQGEGCTLVSGLTSGDAFVAWIQSGTNSSIQGHIISPNGTPLGNEFQISQNTTYLYYTPSVVSLNNSNVFVAWEGYSGGNWSIYGRVLFPNGSALSNEFQINQNTTNECCPSIASLNNGKAMVVWDDGAAGPNIYGRIFFPNGTAQNDQFIITSSNAYEGDSAITLDNGNVFIAYSGGGGCTSWCIFGKVIFPNGTTIQNDFGVSQVSTDANQLYPVVANVNGNAFVVWGAQQQTGRFVSYGRVFYPNGTALGNQFMINQNTYQSESALVSGLTNGDAFVSWVYQSSPYSIYGRILTPAMIATLGNPPATTQALTTSAATTNAVTTSSITTRAATTRSIATQSLSTNSLSASTNIAGTTGSLASTNTVGTTNLILSTASATSLNSGSTISQGTTEASTSGNMVGTTNALSTTGGSTSLSNGATTEQATTGSFANSIPTSPSTLSPAQSSHGNQSGNNSVPLIAGVAGGVGGVVCLTAGGFVAWKYFRHRQSPQERHGSFNLEQMAPDPFAQTKEEGIESLRTNTINGAFGGHFARYTETNRKLYQLIEEQTGKKVTIPDLSIGKGAYGELTVVRNIVTGEFVADKTVTGERQIEESLGEGRIQDALVKAKVPNIVPLLDYVRKVDTQGVEILHQIMPLAVWNGEELKEKRSLLEDEPLKGRLLYHVSKKLLEAVSYMHKAGYFHLDIKPTNFLVTQDMSVLLADFGRTKKIENPNQAKEELLGDRRYFSPDLYRYVRHWLKKQGEAIEINDTSPTFSAEVADIWALAQTLLEIELNQPAFTNPDYGTKIASWKNTDFQNMVESTPALQKPPSNTVLSAVKKMLVIDPKKAISLAQMLKDSVFKQKNQEISPEEGKHIFRTLNTLLPKANPQGSAPMASYGFSKEKGKDENYAYSSGYSETQPKDRDENYNYHYNKAQRGTQPASLH